jgi:hypothetical protein
MKSRETIPLSFICIDFSWLIQYNDLKNKVHRKLFLQILRAHFGVHVTRRAPHLNSIE